MGSLLDQFRKEAKQVWKPAKVIDKLKIDVKKGKTRSGVSELRFKGKPAAISDILVKGPKEAQLVLDDAFFKLSKQKQSQTLRHEAGHLGYPRHNRQFKELMKTKGGILSQKDLF